MSTMRILPILVSLAVLPNAWPQSKYKGPMPPEADTIYLVHASNLLPTEAKVAKEEPRKDENANVIEGAASPTRTPLAEPIFLVETKKIEADKLQLYQMDVKNGRREVVFTTNPKKRKDDPQPKRLVYTRLDPGLYRLEVSEVLANGQYCLSPTGPADMTQNVYCFEIY